MKIKRNFILGLIVVFIGASIVEIVIMRTPHGQRPDRPMCIFGFALAAVGGYLMFKAKWQEREKKEQGG